MYKIFISIAFIFYIFVIFYYRFKKPPLGVNGKVKNYHVNSDKINFIYDLSWQEKGKNKSEQKLFQAIRSAVKLAQKIILFDIFLFNDEKTDPNKNIQTTKIIINDLNKKRFLVIL